jgi:hypothetical protein
VFGITTHETFELDGGLTHFLARLGHLGPDLLVAEGRVV